MIRLVVIAPKCVQSICRPRQYEPKHAGARRGKHQQGVQNACLTAAVQDLAQARHQDRGRPHIAPLMNRIGHAVLIPVNEGGVNQSV